MRTSPTAPPTPRPARLPLTPEQALAAWPASEPLGVLWSAGPREEARWTLLARPRRATLLRRLPREEPSADLEHANPRSRDAGALARSLLLRPLQPPAGVLQPWATDPDLPPFAPGYLAMLSYDLGAALEPRAQRRFAPHPPAGDRAKSPDVRDQDRWPLVVLARVQDALVYDRLREQWWAIGDPPPLAELRDDAPTSPTLRVVPTPLLSPGGEAYQRGVRSILGYIRAGDVYQVNLAAPIRAQGEVSPRALAQALFRGADPWLGALLSWEERGTPRAVVSASPELFLRYDPLTNLLATRPMKGTRPQRQRDDLEASPKDRAELAMIVDLMRNDLGRVCELGSVRVQTPRRIETHAGLAQATALVCGSPTPRVRWIDVLRAAFPPGSVTGAPKIRAMQIIDELEDSPRGPYCGALGYFSDSGHASLSVAIRTAALTRVSPQCWDLTWRVGAGIVADSDPRTEWLETLYKASALARAGAVQGLGEMLRDLSS